MEKGDLVVKKIGQDVGQLGLLLEIVEGGPGNLFAYVLSQGSVKWWYQKYVEVFKC